MTGRVHRYIQYTTYLFNENINTTLQQLLHQFIPLICIKIICLSFKKGTAIIVADNIFFILRKMLRVYS